MSEGCHSETKEYYWCSLSAECMKHLLNKKLTTASTGMKEAAIFKMKEDLHS
jgi:hypothetical protein